MSRTENRILSKFAGLKGQIAVLIDPEKVQKEDVLEGLVEKAHFAQIDYFFVGGSTVTRKDFEKVVSILRKLTKIPIIIFPGDNQQLSQEVDGILYLSLLSGRNPDYLIGQHVTSAREVYDLGVEVIPTAYLLIDGGSRSSVAYVSQTTPIPRGQGSIALNTALAGILQGKKVVYFDAGSGAKHSVPSSFVRDLNKTIDTITIVGGGIKTTEQIENMADAGANVIVIGNKLEENIDFLLDIKKYKEKVV